MPIASSDIEVRYSAPTALAGDSISGVPGPGMSLGGYASRTVLPDKILNSLFPPMTAAPAIDYQCVFVVNRHPYYTLYSAVAWILSQNANWQTTLLGMDPTPATDVGSSAQQAVLIPNRTSTPAGAGPFTVAATKVNGVQLGDIMPNQAMAVWISRTNIAATGATGDTPSPAAPVALFGAGTLTAAGTVSTGTVSKAGTAGFSGLGNLVASAMTTPHGLAYLSGSGQLVAVANLGPLTYLPRPIPGSVTMRVEGFSPA